MRRLVYLFFFFSGLCGLVYEVLWTRLFVLVMGGTVYSFTTVLVAYMSGLALGGWLGGRYADRLKTSPLLLYGILEAGVGIYCLLIPLLIQGLNPIFDGLYPVLVSHRFLELLVRFFFSLLILVFPTTLMGATLPILVRYIYSKPERFGEATGGLYTTNTAGAVAGSFLSGMILIPSLGQMHTLYLSAGINLLIFFTILILFQARRKEFVPVKPQLEEQERERAFNLKAGLVLLGYALSGCSAMIYQVAWSRALILSLGTTLYVLSLILTAYIAGLAVGAGVITPLVDKIKRLWLWVGIFELLIGITAWAVVPFFAQLPLWMIFIYRPESYTAWLALEFLIGMGLIFLPTFLMGALFPLVCRLYSQLRGGVGEAVGEVYAWNTIGAIAGSFLCGFVLISALGLKNSLIFASALSILIGLGFISGEKIKTQIKLSFQAGSLVVLVALIFLAPGWNPKIINSGPYVYYKDYISAFKNVQELKRHLETRFKTLFYKEGVEATVSVFQTPDKILALRINGKTDASTGDDIITQIFSAHLPLLLHPHSKKVMILGLASGMTMGSVLTHPVEEVDCVEISPEVVEASQYFNDYNNQPLSDERSWLLINDARYYLAHTSKRYDVIISEPSNPWIGGMGLLFTREFFQQVRERLEPGGIFLLWMEVYNLDLKMAKMLVRTFLEVFPNASLWESIPGSDYILLGVNDGFQVDFNRIKQALENEKIKTDLARINLNQPEKILARFLMGPEKLREFANNSPIHTDDRRQMELYIPRIVYEIEQRKRQALIVQEFIKYRGAVFGYLSSRPKPEEIKQIEKYSLARLYNMEAMYLALSKKGQEQALEKFKQALKLDPEDNFIRQAVYEYYFLLGRQELAQGKIDSGIQNLIQAWQYYPKSSMLPDLAGFYFLEKGDFKEADKWLARALEQNPEDPFAWYLKGRLALVLGQLEQAKEQLEKAISLWGKLEEKTEQDEFLKGMLKQPPRDFQASLYFYLAEVHRLSGRELEALSGYEQALLIKPNYPEALVASGKIFLKLGNLEASLKRFSQAVELEPKNPFIHLLYAQALERAGKKEQAVSELKKSLELLPKDWQGRVQIEKQIEKLTSFP